MENSFLNPEIRCDFKVTSKRKKVWEIEITILEEIKRICDKYNIHWWIDGGCLLGAVRHKGFIPWDDDIDVSMLREDYNRFIEVAPLEIKSPYYFMCSNYNPDFVLQFSRVQIDGTTMITYPKFFKEGLHQGIFVDVFPHDFVNVQKYEDRKQEQMNNLMHCWASYNDKPKLKEYVQKNFNFLNSFEKTDLSEIFMLIKSDVTRRNVVDVLDTIEVPFEYTTVMIPRNYKPMLDRQYPEWETKFIKGGQMHKTVVIDPYKDYKEFTWEEIQNLEKEMKTKNRWDW